MQVGRRQNYSVAGRRIELVHPAVRRSGPTNCLVPVGLVWELGQHHRPAAFGKNFVDGFDFDIELSSGAAHYPAMISTLRSKFATDPGNKYYITGAPQCPIPEPNMGTMIQNAVFRLSVRSVLQQQQLHLPMRAALQRQCSLQL